ncbi:MAG TPA: AI-2E family transporter, partial [Elusimicrobiota bacterium]|nr:AI-2E family transporter [Elusimicrobiota bacterium]
SLSWGMVVLVLGILAWFLHSVRLILPPFVMAAILAYLLNPVVSFFEIRGLRRDTVVLILFALLVAAAVGLAYGGLVAIWQDLPDLRAQWPAYMRQADSAVVRLQNDLSEYVWVLKERRLLEKGVNAAMAWVEQSLWHSPSVVASALTLSVNVLLTPFIAFFFLRGGAKLAQGVLDICPGRWVERFLSLFNKFDEVLGNYTRGVVFEAFLVGLFSVAGLTAIGLDYAALIGIATGIGNMIPYLGPLLGGAVGLVVALFQFGTLPALAKVLIIFTVVHYIDSYVLQPLIMKRSVNLTPVTVVFALLCGGHLAGLWGLVFAVPVASLIKEASRIFFDWYRAERGYLAPAKDIALAAARPWVV